MYLLRAQSTEREFDRSRSLIKNQLTDYQHIKSYVFLLLPRRTIRPYLSKDRHKAKTASGFSIKKPQHLRGFLWKFFDLPEHVELELLGTGKEETAFNGGVLVRIRTVYRVGLDRLGK